MVGSRYRVKTNKTSDTDNSRLKIQSEDKQNSKINTENWWTTVCCSSVLCVYFWVLFVFTLYLEPTIVSVTCFVCLHSVSWAYHCQCPLFSLSLLCILSLLLSVSLVLFFCTLYLEPTIVSVPCFVLAIVGSRYSVKTNKTRNTGNSRLKIQSEEKQNKWHWQ
jgi:hypothetical protein